MNYELAKELKEAGWPQSFSEGMDYYDKKGVFCESACSEYNHDQDWAIRVPTLEELIEACRSKLDTLENYGDMWQATQKLSTWKVGEWEYVHGKGNTPSEAVARLWLALNKKEATP